MKHSHFTEYKETEVNEYNSQKTTIRVLIDQDEAPNFIMRRFEIKAGGRIGIHSHAAEHEIYIIEGRMTLLDANNSKINVKEGNFIFIPSEEKHGYLNDTQESCIFICVIPKPKK